MCWSKIEQSEKKEMSQVMHVLFVRNLERRGQNCPVRDFLVTKKSVLRCTVPLHYVSLPGTKKNKKTLAVTLDIIF